MVTSIKSFIEQAKRTYKERAVEYEKILLPVMLAQGPMNFTSNEPSFQGGASSPTAGTFINTGSFNSSATAPVNFSVANQNANPNNSPTNIMTNTGSTPQINIDISELVVNNKKSKQTIEDERIEADDKSKDPLALAKIPDELLRSSSTNWEPLNYKDVSDNYKLYDLARTEIKFEVSTQKLIYTLIEPELTKEETELLTELKKAFIYVFEKFSPEYVKLSEREVITQGVKQIIARYRIKVTDEQFKKLTYYLERDFLGLESIQPLMYDPYIEDISCDGLNVPIFVNHLKFGTMEVNRRYIDSDKLNSFIVKLAQKSNQEISLSKPILQGALPDGSRVEAIYGKEISGKGSSYTIRKFRAEPFTPVHLIEFGTMPPLLLAFLWVAVENKQSLLVSGGTATGKTTILNALSLFVPPTNKIVSIEDTPEINLPHEHWLSLVSRESEGRAEVTMFDLLKASLRERPDYIIVGEIRGAEAAILFQGMATGHAGLGTVHADKFQDLVNRMTIAPINLPKQLLTEIDLIIFMKQLKVKNNLVRRAASVVEIIDYDSQKDKFYTNELVTFNPTEDTFRFKPTSAVVTKLIERRGGKETAVWTEIEKRRRILELLHTYKILEFKEVTNIIQAYYQNPAEIFNYLDAYVAKRGK